MKDHNSYLDHPGSLSGPCVCKITVNKHPTGLSMNGYACAYTGGHCLPRECKNREEREEWFIDRENIRHQTEMFRRSFGEY